MRRAYALIALALFACHRVGQTDDVDVDAEAAAAAGPGGQSGAIASAKSVAALFVAEDPTIDPTQTPGRNGDFVAARLTARTASCAAAMVTHAMGSATVSIDFGAGCTIDKIALSGQVAVTLSRAGTGIMVGFAFTALMVNQYGLAGTFTATTSDGMAYTYAGDLTSAGSEWVFMGTIDPAPTGLTIDGTDATTTASGTVDYTLSKVHHSDGSCYADAGSISFTKPAKTLSGMTTTTSETLAFDAMTPQTGKATLTIGALSATVTLPKYGTCPHP